ncbi:MAG: SDR family oxidoreductase [Candidatus Hodarchaeota archaeon]
MDLGLKDQVALVTASSRGLGKAAALQFAREGARVAICARTEHLEVTANEIRDQTGAEVLDIRTDLTKPKDIETLVKQTHDHFGRIDILVANNGGPPPGNFLDLQPVHWEAAVDLTLMSTVRLCYGVIPIMLEQGSGSIVATQSYSVKQPIDHLILSNSVRLAVIGLMKSLANEFGPKGIRVNSINPYWTWTERIDQLLADRASRSETTIEEEAAKITQDAPLRRMGTIEEYGQTIVWLASPAASFIHGHALMFDGGAVKATL